jgi:hypothetical protein
MTSPSFVRNSDVGTVQEARIRESCRLKIRHPRDASFLGSEFGQLLCKLCCQRSRLAVTPDTRETGLRDGPDKSQTRRLSPHDLALKGVAFRMISKGKARIGCHFSTLAKNNSARRSDMRWASVQVLLPAIAPALDIPMKHSNFSRNRVAGNFGARTGFSASLPECPSKVTGPPRAKAVSDSAHRRSCLWSSTKSPDGARGGAGKSDGAEAKLCIDLAKLPRN